MTAPNGPVNVLVGFLSVFVGHVLAVALMFVVVLIGEQLSISSWLDGAILYAFLGIGITQVLYVIPLALWAIDKRRFDTMKGIIIGAVITLLLNGGCFWFFSNIFSGY